MVACRTMAMIQCKECSGSVSTKADKCPQCGAPVRKGISILRVAGLAVAGLFTLVAFTAFLAISGKPATGEGASTVNPVERMMDDATAAQMNKINNQVTADQVAQYEMVKRAGDKMQTCVHAGMVEAAYIQAKDDANFQKWTAIKKTDCAAAGLPE